MHLPCFGVPHEQSEVILIGLLPVVVVGFVHEHVSGEEHDVDQPPEEDREGKDEPVFPVLASEDSDRDRDHEQVEQHFVTELVVHFINYK